MRRLLAFIFSYFFCISLNANWDTGVEAISMGKAYRAVALSNDTIFYNPAGLIKKRQISLGLDYIRATNNNNKLALSLADSKTSAWALGLAYLTDFRNAEKAFNNHHVHVSAAMPILTDMLALGASLYYDYNPQFADSKNKHFFNTSLGLLFASPVGLSLALVIDRLLNPKGQEESRKLSLAFALDLGLLLPILPMMLAADWQMGFASNTALTHSWALGLEYKLMMLLPLRAGVRSESPNINHKKYYLSLGAGINLAYLDILGFYEQDLEISKNHNFGASVKFNF